MPKPTKTDKIKRTSAWTSSFIGDRVLVNLHHGSKNEALIKAIVPTTGGKKFQVDFGNDQTALIEDWQIMEKRRFVKQVSMRLACLLSPSNAGLAQTKGRSGLSWWFVPIFLGPIATFLLVVVNPLKAK